MNNQKRYKNMFMIFKEGRSDQLKYTYNNLYVISQKPSIYTYNNFNNNTKIAGKDWCYKCMNELRLSFRTPEVTSVGHLICLNKTNVD